MSVVVKMSVTATNSSFQNYTHLDDHTRQTTKTLHAWLKFYNEATGLVRRGCSRDLVGLALAQVTVTFHAGGSLRFVCHRALGESLRVHAHAVS